MRASTGVAFTLDAIEPVDAQSFIPCQAVSNVERSCRDLWNPPLEYVRAYYGCCAAALVLRQIHTGTGPT
jgi:hypothetical protein